MHDGAWVASPALGARLVVELEQADDVLVVQAGPEFKLLGRNSLDEMPLATPAIVRGSLILRTYSKLYRIAKAVPNDPDQTQE